MRDLSLGVNEEIKSRATCSSVPQRLAPEQLEAFILKSLDDASLNHNTFTPEALALIVRPGEGLLQRTKTSASARSCSLPATSRASSISNRSIVCCCSRTDERTATSPSHNMKTNTRDYHTHTNGTPQPPRWNREQIRAACIVAIAPFLEKHGLHPSESGGGNHLMREHPGLIIKDSYWRWPERGMSGSTIDLCMQALRLGFNDAMLALSQASAGHERRAGQKAS